eukprot:Tbor_TRINITY_DN5773_c4_g1::TRINITY_DN5773_c4_g1_i1::g.20532::m.20532/K10251/HSD17B12, KAR, IFA38; 17beta-estradiol 17-dehydrogenase / very-long-chain 3-oxoacyl-CoA reductase
MSYYYIYTALTLIGAIYIINHLLQILTWLNTNYLYKYYKKINIKEKYSKAGDWVVITGASDGIGLAIATDFAKRKMNIILISRTKSKLAKVASEIQDLYNIKTHIIAFDFSTADDAAYDKLEVDLSVFNIAILVNNVGINYNYPQDFDKIDIKEDLRLLKVNCESQLRMTKIIIPKMKKNNCGGIINLSSFAAKYPTPKLCTYSATKSFNKIFSESLKIELSKYNINIITVTPNLVVSNMTAGVSEKKPKKTFIIVGADVTAKYIIDKLYLNVSATDGHPHHGIIQGLLLLLPMRIINNYLFNLQEVTERRAIAKLAQKRKGE